MAYVKISQLPAATTPLTGAARRLRPLDTAYKSQYRTFIAYGCASPGP